jgi:hypothetical protein
VQVAVFVVLSVVVRSVPVRTATNGTVDQQTKDYLDRRIREGKSKKPSAA